MLLPLVTAEAVFYTLHVRSVEKDAVKRAKERMSLKHKNTSKVGAARAAES